MPVHSCTLDGKPGYQWGGSGACFTYDPASDESRKAARRKANAQQAAAYAHGYRGDGKMAHAPMIVEKLFETTYEKALPVDSALALINKIALEPLTADDVDIRRARLANTKVDRSFEQFSVEHLHRFAETIKSKSMLPGHDRKARPLARVFDASVEQSSDGHHHLLIDYYMRKGSDIAEDVRTGIAKDLSIGFAADRLDCSKCGEEYDRCKKHKAGRTYDGEVCIAKYAGDPQNYEAREASFVWLGCQHDTGTLAGKAADDLFAGHIVWKSADAEDSDLGPGEMTMTEEEKSLFDERADQIKALKVEVEALKVKAAAGEAYLESLRAGIKHKADTLKEDVSVYAKLLATADLETLKSWDDDIQKRFDKAFPPSPQSKMLGHGAKVADENGDGQSGGSGRFPRLAFGSKAQGG